VVENLLPRGRTRQTIHREPHYYPLRNHLLDFLGDAVQALPNGAGNSAPRTTPIEPAQEAAQ